jgi:hypothetical protein
MTASTVVKVPEAPVVDLRRDAVAAAPAPAEPELVPTYIAPFTGEIPIQSTPLFPPFTSSTIKKVPEAPVVDLARQSSN